MSEHCPHCGSRVCGHGTCPECSRCDHCDGGDRNDKWLGECHYPEECPSREQEEQEAKARFERWKENDIQETEFGG